MQQISILGCGWLGFPLAESLIKNGFTVKGSTTSRDKIDTFTLSGIDPFLISLTPDVIEGNIELFLRESEILIIDIPPKLRGENKEGFTDKIKMLIPHIAASGISKVLFVSSTSVYADDNSVVTEETIPQPQTESGKQLVESEQLLLANPNFKTTVLRFGGLTGGDRQPVKHMAGRENLENPDGPVNLIDRADCIGIIETIIEKEAWGNIFNGAHPDHPSREEYYTKKAIALRLDVPKFSREKPSMGKTVSAEKVKTILGYNF